MLNRITLVGRLVRDPEYRAFQDGSSVCNFTLAVDDDYKDQSGQKVTDFIDCTAWRKAAEFMTKYMTKGCIVAASGRMKSKRWTDKDGYKRTSWFVNCDNVYSCGGSREATPAERSAYTSPDYTSQTTHPATYGPGDFTMLEDDDGQLPF